MYMYVLPSVNLYITFTHFSGFIWQTVRSCLEYKGQLHVIKNIFMQLIVYMLEKRRAICIQIFKHKM